METLISTLNIIKVLAIICWILAVLFFLIETIKYFIKKEGELCEDSFAGLLMSMFFGISTLPFFILIGMDFLLGKWFNKQKL